MTLRWKKDLTEEETVKLQSLIHRIEQLDAEGGTVFDGTLPGKRIHKLVHRGTTVDGITLPDEYELNFTLEYPADAPALQFMISDSQSGKDDTASFYWSIDTQGFLGPMNSRQLGGSSNVLPKRQEPLLKSITSGSRKFSIVKTGNYARVYCDGEMLYPPVLSTWHGGQLLITGAKLVTLSDLTVYDIGRKIVGENEYQESGLTVPAKPQTFQKLTYLPYRDYLSHFDADDWKIYNPAALRMTGGMAKFSDEIMFAFRHELPSYYQMNFSVKRPTSGIILLKFFKELPETENITKAFWSQPGLTVVITSDTYAFYQTSPTAVCRADNAIPLLNSDHIGLSGKVSIVRADGVLIVNNRFIIADDEILGKYPAFYVYGCTDNPMRNLEIIQEYPFDLTHFTQSYFDSISLSLPKLKDNHEILSTEIILESKAPVTGDRLKYLLPGIVYHSEKLKPAVSGILKNLPPVSSKTFADWLDGSSGLYFNGDIYGGWAVFGKKYNTPEKYDEALLPGAREISEKLGLPWSSAMEIMKKRYPMHKE